MKKQYYHTVDYLKLIFSILIVALHTQFFLSDNTFYTIFFKDIIIRIGVPFFFLSSSFFLSKRIRAKKTKSDKFRVLFDFTKRIFILYVAWFIFNLPQAIALHGDKTFIEWLQRFFFLGAYRGSWYLLALIYGALFVYTLNILKVNELTIFVLTLILYQIPVLYSFYDIQNAIVTGFSDFLPFSHSYSPYVSMIFISLGNLFDKYEEHLGKIKHLFILFLPITIICAFYEVFLNQDRIAISDNYFSLILTSSVTFLLSIFYHVPRKPKRFIRNSSTIIFLSQFIFIFFIEIMAMRYDINMTNQLLFLIVLLLCSLLSLHINKRISNHKQSVYRYLI